MLRRPARPAGMDLLVPAYLDIGWAGLVERIGGRFSAAAPAWPFAVAIEVGVEGADARPAMVNGDGVSGG